MKYQIVCNGQKLSQVVQENMIAELSRLEKLLFKSEEFECRIVVKFRNNKSKVEITIPTPFLLLRSEVEANDLMDAVEIARDKLVAQIDKVKSRLDRSSNKVNLGRTFGYAEEEEEVDSCPNHNRNQREDDVVKRDELFVDEDKEPHDCRRENDVEDWLFLDFDRDVALEEVSD